MEEMQVHWAKMMRIRGDDECNEGMRRSKRIRESGRKEGGGEAMKDERQIAIFCMVFSCILIW